MSQNCQSPVYVVLFALSSVQDALRRVATVESNVQQLEDQALKVSSLLERARDATGAQRTALKAEASAFSVKDPLLDRFDRLWRQILKGRRFEVKTCNPATRNKPNLAKVLWEMQKGKDMCGQLEIAWPYMKWLRDVAWMSNLRILKVG